MRFHVRLGVRFGALALAAAAGGCGATPETDPVAAGPPSAEPERTERPAPAPVIDRIRLGRGGTLDSALTDLGLSSEQRAAAIDAMLPLVDSRRLSPDTGLSAVRLAGSDLVSVACRPGFDHYVRVTYSPDGTVRAERVDVTVGASVETVGAVVESTVAGALSSRRDAVTLTLLFADIFQWDVDLFVDPRPGDRVRMVYETLRLHRPQSDLPPFGDTRLDDGAYLGVGRVLAASYDGAQARSAAFWIAEDGHGGNYYDAEGRSLKKTFLKSPLNYRRISSGFSQHRRHPITRRVVPHHGVDFVAASGTPVVAAADGRVRSAGWDGALGKAVRIRHGNGYETVYGHLRGFAKGVRAGAQVGQNQVIGYVGATGRATGPHLHYTMVHHGRAINPLGMSNPPSEPLADAYRSNLDRATLTWWPVLLAIRTDADGAGIARAAASGAPRSDG